MCVNTHISRCACQRFVFTIRNVFLCFWVNVLLGQAKIFYRAQQSSKLTLSRYEWQFFATSKKKPISKWKSWAHVHQQCEWYFVFLSGFAPPESSLVLHRDKLNACCVHTLYVISEEVDLVLIKDWKNLFMSYLQAEWRSARRFWGKTFDYKYRISPRVTDPKAPVPLHCIGHRDQSRIQLVYPLEILFVNFLHWKLTWVHHKFIVFIF